MTRFIWVRDCEKKDHFINVKHIARVTKSPAQGAISEYAYIIINDGTVGGKYIGLSKDTFDTAEDVISKIQVAMA